MIGSQGNYKIKTKIGIYFYKMILLKVFNIKLIFTQNTQKYKFAAVYETGIMAKLTSITQAPSGGSTCLTPRTENIQMLVKLCSR